MSKRRLFMDDWMDDWTMSDAWDVFDILTEKEVNADFISACKRGDLNFIKYELQNGRDPNMPVLKKSPLWYAKNKPEAVKLLLEYGAIPNLYGFYDFCRKFFKDELLELCTPFLTSAAGRDIFKRLQQGRRELEKRYALCLENNCKTIMEYNQTAEIPLKKYFMVFPFVHTLTEEEREILFTIAAEGQAADIHIAIGSVDKELPSLFAGLGTQKISPPVGTTALLYWHCPGYSVNTFSRCHITV